MRSLLLPLLLCCAGCHSERVTGMNLMDAAGQGDIKTVQEILGKDKSLSSFVAKDGETPLHVSCISGEVQIIKTLLKAGADVNARANGPNSLEMTPLSWCVFGGFKHAVEALVDGGADVNAVFVDEQDAAITVLDVCDRIGEERRDIAQILGAGARRFKELERAHDEA
eukprot:TRINITY_DN62732_c0_g1_i1.p3 TRINITY_DN62732_c0_g1~~TRINITY_DN62732_c0_g1_i1.p3  ORF type:complete len:168 (+),score=48.35 TRINITY_DN62732_c0_g1_i1:124-627(+)